MKKQHINRFGWMTRNRDFYSGEYGLWKRPPTTCR